MSIGNVNRDLSKERKSATFNSEDLTEVLYGGKQAVSRKRYLQNIVLQDKYLQSFNPWWNRTRVEDYDTSVKRSVYVTKLLQDLNITDIVEQNILKEAAGPHEADAFGLHFSMFIPTIEKQGTKQQKKKYLEPARKFQLIGTYAQTEIGHGTFIRGLETTATYDPKTEEFVIHSPTLTSTKYWPGSLGKTSTHVVLMAQLYTGGKCYGMHSFVVQIRSLKDHSPLPGITVMDIGNKLAYSAMDNGFLRFNHVRVPRDAMLMRYSKVEKDGTYIPPSNSKITYGSMVLIRASICGMSGRNLAKCAVIATRYSAVRRQTEIRPGGEEPQVLDYQTQQEKLFPMIAAAYAFFVTGNLMMVEYFRISQNIEEGNMEEMQVLHALAAGLKALSSDVASNGMDLLRKACGGHGYTHASGIPKIWGFTTPACTYEGENTVMYLQCGRYLIKCYEMVVGGKTLPGAMEYLSKPGKRASTLNSQLELSDLVDAYEHDATRYLLKCYEMVVGGKTLPGAMEYLSKPGKRASTLNSQLELSDLVDAYEHDATRYLIKCYEMAVGGKTLPGAMEYLSKPGKRASTLNSQLELSDLVEAYEHVATRYLIKCYEMVVGGKTLPGAMEYLSKPGKRASTLNSQLELSDLAEAYEHVDARYLIKCYEMVVGGKTLPGAMEYLSKPGKRASTLNSQLELSNLVDAYEHVAARYLIKCYEMVVGGKTLPGAMEYLSKPGKRASTLNSQLELSNLVDAYEHADTRYLIKCYEMVVGGKTLPGAMEYLSKQGKRASTLNSQLELSDLTEAYEHVAARLVKVAAQRVKSQMDSGADIQAARNQSGVLIVKAAAAHSRAFAVKTFVEFAEYSISDPDVTKAIQTLCKLFAVHGILANLGDFLQDGYLSGEQAEMLTNMQLDLFKELRPNAVALVDAFDYPDHVLQSCLGRYDGNVYEALYEYAKGSPLNSSDVLDSYHSTLRPLMKGELLGKTAVSKL